MGRAPCCDKANVKRGPWSPEEDDKLKSYIGKHGTPGNWIALPQRIGLKRCGKSCRLRWLNYLRPNIKHGGFTESEDNLICTLYASIGSRWSIIAAQLPGRTDNNIKNYWNTRLKKKLFGKQQTPRSNSGGGSSLNSPPEKVAALPFLGGYWSGDRLHDPTSNSLTNISLMPQIKADDISYDHHTQVINQGKICEDQYQQPYDGMYGSMPQLLDGVDVDGFSAIDVVNNSIISSSSLENTSSGYTTIYEVCYQEMQQYWTLFDESRLLSYSQ